MPASLDAIFYCDEPPDIEFRDGVFRIVQQVGGYRFERVVPPHAFLKAMRRANAAIDAWRNGAKVIRFPTPDSEEAAIG